MPKLKFLISRVKVNNASLPIVNIIPKDVPIVHDKRMLSSKDNDKHNFKTWYDVLAYWFDVKTT